MEKEELNHLEDLIAGFDELVANLKELDKQAEKNNSEKAIDNNQ
jgi:hypothetical protein